MVDTYILNAFTDVPGGGNPAGVVPDASALTEVQMQKIARNLGHSETAFVTLSEVADFKVRFFTPAAEVDLCGHATIATFSLLRQLGKISVGCYSQETKAGVLGIQILDSNKVFMTQTKPFFGEHLDRAVIASTLNVDVQSLHSELLPQIVSTGLRDIVVPVRDFQTLNKIQPDFDAIAKLSAKFNVVGYHLFSLDSLTGVSAHCRNFAPLFDIPEESATGSASGALSCYLFEHKLIDEKRAQCLEFEQGHYMNRPSKIEAKLEIVSGKIEKVTVGGSAYLVKGPGVD